MPIALVVVTSVLTERILFGAVCRRGIIFIWPTMSTN